MNQGRIIVITGAPGTGKTTTASVVAKESDLEKSVHMHTDDFYHYLSKGAIPPHLPESIVNNPVYCILNLCRFYALIRDDLTLSKYDGGKWALENMDSNYNDVIKNAMEDYLSDTNNSYDNTRLKEFAGEAISLINDCVNTNKIRK